MARRQRQLKKVRDNRKKLNADTKKRQKAVKQAAKEQLEAQNK